MTTTTTTTTTTDLTAQLKRLGFARDPSTGWYDDGPTRVVIDDDGDQVSVYRFTNDTARLLTWRATFSKAPVDLVLATITHAANSAPSASVERETES